MVERFSLFVLALLVLSRPAFPQTIMQTPLYWTDAGGIYMNIAIGSPPQGVSVLVDTGSSTLAVPGSCSAQNLCINYPNTTQGLPVCTTSGQTGCVSGVYNFQVSQTAQLFPYESGPCGSWVTHAQQNPTDYCGFGVQYGSALIQGALVDDNVVISGVTTNVVGIGATYAMSMGFQEAPAAGIFGFAFESLNCLSPGEFDISPSDDTQTTCNPSPLSQFLNTLGLSNMVGFCFGGEAGVGRISFGGANESLYQNQLSYTPVVQGAMGAYTHFLTSIVGLGAFNTSTSLQPTISAIIDTGTPSLVLPSPLCDFMTKASSAASCQTNADCNHNLYIYLNGGVNLPVGGMFQCTAPAGVCEPAFAVENLNCVPSSPSAEVEATIGNAVIGQFYVLFDKVNYQVGFASPSNMCLGLTS